MRPRVNRDPAAAAVIEFVGHPVAILTGRTLRIYCIVTGSPRPTVAWEKNGKTLVSSRGRVQVVRDGSLFVRPVVESDSGVYTCVGSNIVGTHKMSSTVDVLGTYSPVK